MTKYYLPLREDIRNVVLKYINDELEAIRWAEEEQFEHQSIYGLDDEFYEDFGPYVKRLHQIEDELDPWLINCELCEDESPTECLICPEGGYLGTSYGKY